MRPEGLDTLPMSDVSAPFLLKFDLMRSRVVVTTAHDDVGSNDVQVLNDSAREKSRESAKIRRNLD